MSRPYKCWALFLYSRSFGSLVVLLQKKINVQTREIICSGSLEDDYFIVHKTPFWQYDDQQVEAIRPLEAGLLSPPRASCG